MSDVLLVLIKLYIVIFLGGLLSIGLCFILMKNDSFANRINLGVEILQMEDKPTRLIDLINPLFWGTAIVAIMILVLTTDQQFNSILKWLKKRYDKKKK